MLLGESKIYQTICLVPSSVWLLAGSISTIVHMRPHTLRAESTYNLYQLLGERHIADGKVAACICEALAVAVLLTNIPTLL